MLPKYRELKNLKKNHEIHHPLATSENVWLRVYILLRLWPPRLPDNEYLLFKFVLLTKEVNQKLNQENRTV